MSATEKTMYKAVEDEILCGFVQNGCEFSAHDVTVNIRHKVNNGELKIEGLPFEDVDGVNTQLIEHNDVRTCVHQVCSSDLPSGYKRQYNRNGGYYGYAPVQVRSSTTSHSPISTPFSTPSTRQAVGAKSPISAADPKNPVVIAKVTNYFDHRMQNGTPATLHQTQCRMKRDPLTIAQIKQIATSNGYVVHKGHKQSLSSAIVKPSLKKAFSASTSG